jgi:hypothetical protein
VTHNTHTHTHTHNTIHLKQTVSRNASAKLISQITSTMLTRKTLDVSKDSMNKDDWDALLAMEGVVLERKRKGDVLFMRGS